jgi:N-acetyltransferase 10
MSLFVASHYKNSPNDLQLLSDAPAHSIFVLCRNIEKSKETKGSIPDIYAAIQVCEEGGISKNVIINNNKRGFKPAGDLIPWTVSEHYQDNEFPNLKGIRVVRIATHPDCQRMGYGSYALKLLTEFYEGKIINLDEAIEEPTKHTNEVKSRTGTGLTSEEIKPRKKLRPLLTKLSDVKPPFVYYLGTAFGLTKELFNFWRKGDFYPVYLKLSENDITGEHSCIMLKPFDKEDILKYQQEFATTQEYGNKVKWLNPYLSDFKKRLTTLLAYDLKDLSIKLSLSLLDPQINTTTNDSKEDEDEEIQINEHSMSKNELDLFITKYDYRRLELYTKNLVKYSMITDIVPFISKFYFMKKFPAVKLAYTQAAILLGFGLQYKSFEKINEELNLQNNQLLAMFNKMIKKFTTAIKNIYEKEIESEEQKIFAKSEVIFIFIFSLNLREIIKKLV